MLDATAHDRRTLLPAVLSRLAGRPGRQDLRVCFHDVEDLDRRPVEAFLEAAYLRAFGGRLQSHYPTLISVRDRAGQILAAAGYRLASAGPLFLEQYLDEPIDILLARRLGEAKTRSAIAEIGNLACDSPGSSLTLFGALAGRLYGLGCSHAAATATRQLRRSFARVGFRTERLGHADPGRLGCRATDWGDYYDRQPEVHLGAIAPALPTGTRSTAGAMS